jgi:hypothetical protein
VVGPNHSKEGSLVSDNPDGVPEPVALTLTPQHAYHIAESLRLELVLRLEKSWPSARLRREDVESIQALLESYCEQLDMLGWGHPDNDVEIVCERDRLDELASELMEAGQEELFHPEARAGVAALDIRRQALEKVGAAEAIAQALVGAPSSPDFVSGIA